MHEATIITSFLAGLVMFLAPCTLPIVPGFVAFVAGNDKSRAIHTSLLFCLGFLITFLFFGLLAGLLGHVLLPYKLVVQKIGALFVISFGLYVLGLFRIPLFERSFGGAFQKVLHHKFSPFIFGMSFALGWTPCVGPVLAGIFFYAAFAWSVLKAIFLFFFFSLGFIVPFLVVAYLVKRGKMLQLKSSKFFTLLAGLLLIFIGLLLFDNTFNLLAGGAYKALRFIHYEGINNLL
jgi:cytochrome c-type biogenesis protein